MALLKFIGDWIYGLYISFFYPKSEDEPGDEAK